MSFDLALIVEWLSMLLNVHVKNEEQNNKKTFNITKQRLTHLLLTVQSIEVIEMKWKMG